MTGNLGQKSYPYISRAVLPLSAAVLLASASALPAEEHLAGPVEARVLRVVDGDTITVRARIWLRQEVETNVRVAGIDTPETHGQCPEERELARRARELVTERVEGGWVRLRDITSDKYGGRVVAQVDLPDGQSLAEVIVAAKLAHRYDGGRKTPWCPELSER